MILQINQLNGSFFDLTGYRRANDSFQIDLLIYLPLFNNPGRDENVNPLCEMNEFTSEYNLGYEGMIIRMIIRK